jgi:hypothetical protein
MKASVAKKAIVSMNFCRKNEQDSFFLQKFIEMQALLGFFHDRAKCREKKRFGHGSV